MKYFVLALALFMIGFSFNIKQDKVRICFIDNATILLVSTIKTGEQKLK